MKIEITNQQKIKRLNSKTLQKDILAACRLLKLSGTISFLFCDNKQIRSLNKKYFKKASNTDVISFPLEDEYSKNYLGEIVVSVEQAVNMASNYGNSWQKELMLYVIHGILHLIGYTDTRVKERDKMKKKENKILDAIWSKKT
jgi:probable rRNA maturation factor